jgi:ribonucleoside-diphosphate reductase alpha chain
MYLETRDIDETMRIYTGAWRKGVKTTYYLHMKPRHTAEQSTVRVNKAEALGKRGFSAIGNLKDADAFRQPVAEPVPSGIVMTVPLPTLEPVLAAFPVAEAVEEAPQPAAGIRRPGFGALSLQGTAEPVHAFPAAAPVHEVALVKETPAVEAAAVPAPRPAPRVCPSDPMERLVCDSCQ